MWVLEYQSRKRNMSAPLALSTGVRLMLPRVCRANGMRTETLWNEDTASRESVNLWRQAIAMAKA